MEKKKTKTNKPYHLYGLYAITPCTPQQALSTSQLSTLVESAIQGGARIVQYREKYLAFEQRLQQARALRALCDRQEVYFLINDDVALAAAVQADGVHLGSDDMTPTQARQVLGENAIIGVSCYNQLQRARDAQQLGADYAAFGRFFPSVSKPGAQQAEIGLLQQARSELSIPLACIGGINADNAKLLISAGADMVAVINSVFAAADVAKAARQISKLFD